MSNAHKLGIAALAAVSMALVGGCESEPYRAYDGPAGTMRTISYQESGTVSEIDRDNGVFTLLGDESTSRLPFDTAGMQEIKEGDTITAHITVSKIDVDPGRKAYDAPEMRNAPADEKTLGRREVIGTVQNIDDGYVDVRAETMSLKLNFASAAGDLDEGDRVKVQTTFERSSS